MAAQSLKEYLVKLGWDVDQIGLKKATESISTFESKASGMGAKLVSSFGAAGVALVSFVATASVGIAKIVDGIAEADLATERWARRMWTSEENARSLLSALDAMDADFEDIFYMTPEEYRNMSELRNLSLSLKAPTELQDTLKLVRDIGQEADKTKVIFNYATQWISYYIGQYMGKDIKNVHDLWAQFNEYLIEKLPTATEKIAKFFTIVIKLAKALVTTVQLLYDMFQKLFNGMGISAQKGALGISAFLLILKTGPIGLFIVALTTLLLLLEDFYTWQSGGKSAFGGTWEKLTGWFKGIDTSGLDVLKSKTDKLLGSVWDLFGVLGDTFKSVWDFLDKHGVIEQIVDSFIGLLEGVVDVLQFIVDLLIALLGQIDKLDDSSMIKKMFGNTGSTSSAFSIAKGAANAGMGIFDAFPWLWNKVSGSHEGDEFYAKSWSDIFGYDYSWGADSEAAKTTSGIVGGNNTTTSDNRKVNQTNNITINNNNSAVDSYQTASDIIKSFDVWNPFK